MQIHSVCRRILGSIKNSFFIPFTPRSVFISTLAAGRMATAAAESFYRLYRKLDTAWKPQIVAFE